MCKEKEVHLGCACHNIAIDVLIENHASKKPAKKSIIKKLMNEEADSAEEITVFTGVNIRTMHQGMSDKTANTMAIQGNKIISIGDYDTVVKSLNNTPFKIDKDISNKNKTILPGLIEPHVHIVPTAMANDWFDYSPFDEQNMKENYTLDDVMNQMKKNIKLVPPTPQKEASFWLLGKNLDTSIMYCDNIPFPNILADFTCEQLDKISEDIPIFILSASGHTAYINTPAMKTVWTYVQENTSKFGDFLKIFPTEDAFKKTKGVLQELLQVSPAIMSIPSEQTKSLYSNENIMKNLDAVFHDARKRGVTMLYDAGTTSNSYAVLQNYLEKKPANMRIGMAHLCETTKDVDALDDFHLPTQNDIDCYFGSIKIISDGSNQGLTGYQKEPYCCEPAENIGIFNFSNDGKAQNFPPLPNPSDFKELVKVSQQAGWPLMIHANGNQAVEYTIEAYKEAFMPGIDLRNRIEHCSLITDKNIEDIKQYNIYPSFLIGHVGYWGYTFSKNIFKEKAMMLDRCKSVLNKNIPITFHSDKEVSPFGPLRMMEQAMTRKLENSPQAKGDHPNISQIPVLNPDERVSAQEALRAITYDAAWQCHAEHLIGSLEVGKLADFIVVEQDPLDFNEETAYMKIRDIVPEHVFVGGKSIDLSDEKEPTKEQEKKQKVEA